MMFGGRWNLVMLWLGWALMAVLPVITADPGAEEDHDTSSTTTDNSQIIIDIQTFVHDAIHWLETFRQDEEQSPLLWVITESVLGSELLFVVDDVNRRTNVVLKDDDDNNDNKNNLCGCRLRDPPTEEETAEGIHDDCHGSNGWAVVGIIGYIRPGHMGRFCLWEDGRIDSFMSRRVLQANKVALAPTLTELVHQIDTVGPGPTCLPGAHRGIFFETMELLCFALGHKPALIRQRQQQMGGGSGGSNVSLLNGVPANLIVPHTKTLWTWLLKQRQTVWRGLSQVTWGSAEESNPPFEHSVVFARDAGLGQKLVDLHVQDASVPNQVDDVATAHYIAKVGQALGYPKHEVRNYLETSGVIPVDMPRDVIDDAMEFAFDRAIDSADDANNCRIEEGEDGNVRECSDNGQPYQELPGFREFLDSAEAQELSPKSMRDVVEQLDSFFFH